MPKILYLLPYSDDGKIHGGKVRSHWISKKLAEIDESFEVVFVNDRRYLNEEKHFWGDMVPEELAGDLDFLTRNYSLDTLVDSKTQLVVLEQPWLWHEVERIKRKFPGVKVIYSSQNVEWELKYKIFQRYLGNLDFEPIVKFIRDLEIKILENVDAILAVSVEDEVWFRNHCQSEVILAKNGTSFDQEEINFSRTVSSSYGLVVGSAHPPNIEGVFTYLSDPDAWLPRGSFLKIVGSLSSALEPIWNGLANRWGEPCVELIESISDDELKDVIMKSSVVLLPVSYGGGTNLKTAEALASNSYVVGSRPAFRGYEEYTVEAGVYMVESSMEFKIRTIGCLNKPESIDRGRLRLELHWNNALEPMKSRISEMLNE